MQTGLFALCPVADVASQMRFRGRAGALPRRDTVTSHPSSFPERCPMTAVVPHALLFRYSIPVRRIDRLPGTGKKLLNLPKRAALPNITILDGLPSFAVLRAAWNPAGIGFSLTVTGRTGSAPFQVDSDSPIHSDGLQLWIDTRNTQSVHRATRFCHHFCVSPTGGGKQRNRPQCIQLPIARSRSDGGPAGPLVRDVPLTIRTLPDGYGLDVWLPAEILTGFDPETTRQLGFYYLVRDADRPEQFLSVGREFPFTQDPSLWSTLDLVE